MKKTGKIDYTLKRIFFLCLTEQNVKKTPIGPSVAVFCEPNDRFERVPLSGVDCRLRPL